MKIKPGFNRIFKKYLDNYALLTVFVVMVIIFTIMMPKFFSFSNLSNVLVQAVSLGIATVGMMLVIIQGGIDLSAGSTMYLSIIICSRLFNTGVGLIPLIAVSIMAGAAVGAVNGFVISKLKVIPFITTLGTMIFARGLGLTFSGQRTVMFNDPAGSLIVNTKIFGVPIIIFVLFAVLIVSQFLLSYTSFGRQLFAIGNNESSAISIGIKVPKLRFIAYLICGACAGLSGLILSAQAAAVPTNLGSGQEFIFISAAVLGGVSLSGGKGRIFPGVLLGILIITIIENGLVLTGANPYAYQIVRGGIIFVAVIFDSINYRGALR